jgi:hypothetical protein
MRISFVLEAWRPIGNVFRITIPLVEIDKTFIGA